MRIVYEDNHLIAVDKRVGDLVQGDQTGDIPLSEQLKAYLKKKYNKQGNVFLGVIHRLDRPVSGIVLFARTSKALVRMNRQFLERKPVKKYWAIVKNAPPKDHDMLTHYLMRNAKQNKSYAYDKPKGDAKKAVLEYTLVGVSDNFYLLEIQLHTGRHHQIRCQLAKIGCPIRGDLKYGFDRSNKDGGIDLVAGELRFLHPVKKEEIVLTADLPDEPLWNHFKQQLS
jgi:23S rRNA pseudouridine1911/1915/1917 synthase